MFRRSRGSRTLAPVVRLDASDEGLILSAGVDDFAVALRMPGSFKPETLLVPGDALSTCEGKGSTPITVEVTGPTQGQVRWDEGHVPRAHIYDRADPQQVPPLPELPRKPSPLDPS